MVQQAYVDNSRKTIICVDSYDDGVLKGRFYNPYQDAKSFSSLSQFLLKMEEMLDNMQMPQSYTTLRRFTLPPHSESEEPSSPISKGAMATFELKVFFRQHSSWQGVVVWQEQKAEQSFRSVLELIILLDSALKSINESDNS